MIPTSFNARRSHSSSRNFIFLWDGQVHLFSNSYSRIESESTATLVTKATNTRLKQQTFQPTETKKSLNLYFITLGAFHSPSGLGVAWFKEGKDLLWKHIHHCHIALNTPCSQRPLFPISPGGGGRVCLRELNKMVGAYGQCENGESNKNKNLQNLQISTELKNLISATKILFTLEFLYAWICWLGEWGEVGR